jgi:hypothetical protein
MENDLPFHRNLSGRNKRFKTETLEVRIHRGNHSHTYMVTSVKKIPLQKIATEEEVRVES